MSFLLDDFDEEMNRFYSVYEKLGLDADGEVQSGFSTTPAVLNQQCMYYTGSAAESLVADRFKTSISGVIISEVIPIADGAKIVLDTGEEFGIVNADDVAKQGEVLVIAVKAVNSGTEY